MKKLSALFPLMLSAIVLLACSDEPDEPISFVPLSTFTSFSTDAEYIAVIGDIQAMIHTPRNHKYLLHTADWLVAMSHDTSGKLKGVLQTGDLTETNSDEEWNSVRIITDRIADVVPFIYTTGNHDYRWTGGDIRPVEIKQKSSTGINSVPLRDPARRTLIELYDESQLENAVYTLTLKGVEYYILAIEFAPRRQVVDWAVKMVEKYGDKPFIVLNHEFLTARGNVVEEQYSFARIQISDLNYVAPEKLWDVLIYPHDNVRALICGHNEAYSWRTAPNASGREVPQIMFNLQFYPHGGDGLIMLIKTDDGHSFSSTVFSTITGDTIHDASHNFVL